MIDHAIRDKKLLPIAVAALALAAAVAAFHHSAITGWWRVDDTGLLHGAQIFHLRDIFFSPQTWAQMRVIYFTPWLNLLFYVDLASFGLNPAAFYMHDLADLWLAGLLTYFLLRLWVGYFPSLIGAAMFIAGEPVFVTAQQLMSRHYIEGLAFAIAAMICYVAALRRHAFALSWIGAALYLIACLNKEIYAPLPLVLLFIPELDLTQLDLIRRARILAPFALAAAAYLLWRTSMIGVQTGIFGVPPHYTVSGIFNAFKYFPKHIFGTHHWALLTAAILALIAVVVARRWTRLALAVAVMITVLLPFGALYTVDSGYYFHDRYIFLPWWATCIAVVTAAGTAMAAPRTSGLGASAGKVAGYAFLMLLALTAGWHTMQITEAALHEHRYFDVTGRAIRDAGPNDAVVQPPVVALYPQFEHFIWKLRGGKGPAIYPKAEYGLVHAQLYPESRVLALDERCFCMRDIRSPGLATVPDSARAPLTVYGSWDGRELRWQLGPYTTGKYQVLTRGRMLNVERTGAIPSDKPLKFVVLYEAPQGWITWSPNLEISHAQASVQFSRSGGTPALVNTP